ncbi:class F sortase [Streptomyces sp. MI02-7b]|nr:class F sortase [Streptomyces sp. MI02-7b]MDX3071632.1 class F sortase [Streptomyces sp. MI02-7b]
MDHYPGEHTTPVPWYGHPDAWYGQPDPWFGQPLPASWEDEVPRAPARPRPASKAPGRAGRQRGKPEPAPRPRQKAKTGRASEPAPKSRAQGAPAAKSRQEAKEPKEVKDRSAARARPAAKSRPATPDTRAAAPKVPKAPAGRGNPPRPAVRATGAGAGAAVGAGRPRAGAAARPAVRRHQQPPPLRLTRRGRRVAGVAVGAVVVTGLVLTFDGFLGSGGPPQPTAASAALAGSAGGAGSGIKAPPPLPPAQPTRVRIPSIGVDAPLMNVGLDKDGVIETPPPEEKNEAAWYKDSVSPGARGASVIVGHVDNMSGPAVFYSLGALKKGSTIEVARDDGTTAVFTIFGIEVFNRTGFPAHRVYGDTKDPELRVITCGGTYSSASGYSGNVVVFARMSKTRSAADEKARGTEKPGKPDGTDKADKDGKAGESATTGAASPTATPGKEEKTPAG